MRLNNECNYTQVIINNIHIMCSLWSGRRLSDRLLLKKITRQTFFNEAYTVTYVYMLLS